MTRISPPYRSPSGRRAPHHPRFQGASNHWRRLRDKFSASDIQKFSGNPMWGTVIGKLYMDGVLTEAECAAARLYAEVTGRYDRFHPNAERMQRTPKSPAWEFGTGGQFDVVAHHENLGTIKDYEKKARAAQKAYAKIEGCIPHGFRWLVDEICLYDREDIHSSYHADLKAVLSVIAHRFGLRDLPPEQQEERRKRAKRAANVSRRVESAVHACMARFRANFVTPTRFRIGIMGRADERGFTVWGIGKNGDLEHETVLIQVARGDLPAQIDAAFLTALTKEGLEEAKPSGAPASAGQ